MTIGVRAVLVAALVSAVALPVGGAVAPVAATSPLEVPAPLVVPADPRVHGYSLLVVAPGGRDFVVDTSALPGAGLTAWWIDPRAGTVLDAGSVQRTGATRFFPPRTGPADAGRDWILVIGDAAARPAAPAPPA